MPNGMWLSMNASCACQLAIKCGVPHGPCSRLPVTGLKIGWCVVAFDSVLVVNLITVRNLAMPRCIHCAVKTNILALVIGLGCQLLRTMLNEEYRVPNAIRRRYRHSP